MFRQSLDSGAPYAMCFLTPSSGAGFQSRATMGGLSTYVQGPLVTPPFWLKLQRVGDTFDAYVAPDGTNWTVLGSITITMSDAIYAGLAVTAHNNARLNTATLDNIHLLLPAPPPLAAQPPRLRSPVPKSVN